MLTGRFGTMNHRRSTTRFGLQERICLAPVCPLIRRLRRLSSVADSAWVGPAKLDLTTL